MVVPPDEGIASARAIRPTGALPDGDIRLKSALPRMLSELRAPPTQQTKKISLKHNNTMISLEVEGKSSIR